MTLHLSLTKTALNTFLIKHLYSDTHLLQLIL